MVVKQPKPKRTKKSDTWAPLIGHTPAVVLPPCSKRQSITFPEDLWQQVDWWAKQRHETFSKAVLRLMRLGLAEEARAKERLREVVRKIQAAGSDEAADAYVDELTEAVFGPQQRSPRA